MQFLVLVDVLMWRLGFSYTEVLTNGRFALGWSYIRVRIALGQSYIGVRLLLG